MTPIAHMLAKDATLPLSKRRYMHIARDIDVFDQWHFFEGTAVSEAATDIGKGVLRGVLACVDAGLSAEKAARLAFPPAVRTWIEDAFTGWMQIPGYGTCRRIAYLLDSESPRSLSASVTILALLDTGDLVYLGPEPLILLPLFNGNLIGKVFSAATSYQNPDSAAALCAKLYGLLAMINSPRVIMRHQHMPHRGLERSLLAVMRPVGMFPLHGWTELRLVVAPPRVSDREPVEAHLTGSKALHFCRCHLRIRIGILELVSAHWRGDPALGIKRTRYRVEFPKGRAA